MSFARQTDAGVLVDLKAVPGAKSDEVVGRLGDRLKVKVTAPPEDGRANDAILALLARDLGVDARCIVLVRGAASAHKTVRIAGKTAREVEARWPA